MIIWGMPLICVPTLYQYMAEKIQIILPETDSILIQPSLFGCSRLQYLASAEPGHYSNMLWEAYELDLEKLLDYPVWYADYEELPQTPYRFSMWQYSSTGIVPGIEGNVDLNIQLLKK